MSAPRLLAPAERELRTARRWYESKRPGLGAAFLGAVHAVMGRIAEHPGMAECLSNFLAGPEGVGVGKDAGVGEAVLADARGIVTMRLPVG